MPKRCGSGTCLSRIWATGGSADASGRLEGLDERAEVLLEQVVAEVHDEVVGAEEVAGDQHAVGEAERGVLGDVGDLGPEPAAVAERLAHLRSGVAGDHADLGDPGVDHGLDAVEEDRRVGDGDELLGPRVGDRPQPRAGATGQDEGLHTVGQCTARPSATVGRRPSRSRSAGGRRRRRWRGRRRGSSRGSARPRRAARGPPGRPSSRPPPAGCRSAGPARRPREGRRRRAPGRGRRRSAPTTSPLR